MSGTVDYSYLSKPTVVNPLTAIQQGNQAAESYYKVQDARADQAWGNALQQATDPTTGQVDFPTAQRLAAQDPLARQGMARNLKNNADIMGQQIAQGNAVYSAIGRGAASVMNDPSDGNLRSVIDDLKRQFPGQSAQLEADFNAASAMSPADRVKWAYRHLQGSMDARDAMVRSPFGTTTSMDIGGTIQSGNLVQPSPYGPGGLSVGGGVTKGAPPGTFVGGQVWVSDGKGGGSWQPVQVPASQLQPGGQPVSGPPANPRGPGANQPPAGPSTAPPPPPAGTTIRGAYGSPGGGSGALPVPPTPPAGATSSPPGPSGSIQGSSGNLFAGPGAPPSNAGPAPEPSTAAISDADVIASRLGGGAGSTPFGAVQVAQNYPPAGTASSPILQTPGGPVIQAGPPVGYTGRLAQDQDQYASDQKAIPTHTRNVTNLDTALEALKLADMGKSTGAVHNFYSFLSSQGIAPPFMDNNVAQYDIARKAMMDFAASRASAGGTDMARVQSELSNASPGISAAASRHVLLQNLGLENMEMAANREQQDTSGAGYGQGKAKFYKDYDPRGFAWDRYNETERGVIQAEAAKTKGGLEKLNASVQKAIDLGLVHPPTKQSQAAPASPTSTPPDNALAMASPGNALAA